MALIYATPTDLSAWTGAAAPANATQLIRSASRLVRQATSVAFYAVDAQLMPTDTGLVQAFKDATCAQVTLWAVNGIDPSSGGITAAGVLKARAIGTAKLDYDTTAATSVTAFAAKAFAARTLCRESIEILQQAGITTNSPWIAG
jgi:hypothetical protein